MQPTLQPMLPPAPLPVVHRPTTRLPRRHRSGFAPATVFEAALTDLAADRATGALHGSAGTVHLVDGEVVHAESPATPDVGTLLTSAGRLSARTWADAMAATRGTGNAAEHLVAAGAIGRGELELCHLTAVLDAAFFALPQNDGPIGFLPGVRPGLTLVRPLDAGELRLAVGRRRALLERTHPAAGLDVSPVRARTEPATPDRRAAACSGRRRAVLAAADGYRTPAQIARLLGRSAYTTLLDIRHLAAVGLVETPAVRDGPAPVAAVGPAVAAGPATGPVAPPVPSPAPVRPGGVPPQAGPPPAHPEVLLPSPALHDFPPDPEIALLLRIRAALEARL
ncbi:transcriptional regulator [Kitasatospora sp. NPDC093679]|uniref:transcriptional regulator n=1 Tax=Kitasatospora sp. NPDC093679 TaxID=3154983 RepID=UPI00343AC90F